MCFQRRIRPSPTILVRHEELYKFHNFTQQGAEQRIWGRLGVFKGHKLLVKKEGKEPPVVGVLGCMAERLKTK